MNRRTTRKPKEQVRLLRWDQVVEKLHALGMDDVNKTWVDNKTNRGELPFVKVGKYRRYREDLLDKVIEKWVRDAKW